MGRCRRRKGSYLPTVPELTHMPLCWWSSRSLEPDKETEEGVAFVPLFVPDSHKANVGVAQEDRAALSHPPVLLSLLIPLSAVLTRRRCRVDGTLLRLESSPDGRKCGHNCHIGSLRRWATPFSVVVSPADFTGYTPQDIASRHSASCSSCVAFTYSKEKKNFSGYVSHVSNKFPKWCKCETVRYERS